MKFIVKLDDSQLIEKGNQLLEDPKWDVEGLLSANVLLLVKKSAIIGLDGGK